MFHGQDAEYLEEVGDDHVAKGAGLFIKSPATFDGERFGYVDLDVAHVAATPERLEEFIREAQRQDVVDGLLAEEVVDAEDL